MSTTTNQDDAKPNDIRDHARHLRILANDAWQRRRETFGSEPEAEEALRQYLDITKAYALAMIGHRLGTMASDALGEDG